MSAWRVAEAPAKLNLALVVGPRRPDGKHEVMTLLERLSLADTVAVRRAEQMRVDGFSEDTLVRAALEVIAGAARDGSSFEARIEKRVPVAAGLGGGSSDAATALLLANELLAARIAADELPRIAATVGADVPFFLCDGPQLATGDGTELAPIELPRGYIVLLVLPKGATKTSTADVYAEFDRRRGERGFPERCAALRASTAKLLTARDLALLPPNDLAASPLAEQLVSLGAFRADVTGAGPAVYGLFDDAPVAEAAAAALAGFGRTWIAEPG